MRSYDVVNRLVGDNFTFGSLLVGQIKELMIRDWLVTMCHIPRVLNKVADVLAKV